VFDQFPLLGLAPLLVFDGFVEVVVVAFPALLAVPALNMILVLHNSRDF
jgi:hypothetical protein